MADVVVLIQDSQGTSSTTVGNIKTIVRRMITKLSADLIDTDFKFAVAKYATSRRMSCFGSAQETISYMDNEYQHGGSGLNQLNLALSKMVLKQFDKRPDDRKEETTKVSFTFGYFPFWLETVWSTNLSYLHYLYFLFIKIALKNLKDFGKKGCKN